MNPLHIMVVEDEPKIAQLLMEYLERDGYQVTVLHEGTHATEQIREQSPDFLILDLMLPGKDGLEICKEVRQFSQLPIVMVTAKVEEIDRLLGLEIGADDYITKPFQPDEVIARVNTHLTIHRLKREVESQKDQLEHELEFLYRGLTARLHETVRRVVDEDVDRAEKFARPLDQVGAGFGIAEVTRYRRRFAARRLDVRHG